MDKNITDDLDRRLEELSTDPEPMINVFAGLANVIASGDVELSKKYTGKLVSECDKLETNDLVAGVKSLSKGLHLYFNGRYDDSVNQLRDAIRIFDNTDYDDFKGIAQFVIGSGYRSWGEIDLSVSSFLYAVEKLNPDSDLAMYYGYAHYQLGEIYLYINDFESSDQHYQIALEVSEKLKNPGVVFRAFNGLGNLYMNKGDFEKAEDYFSKSLSLEDIGIMQKSRSYCDLGVLSRKNKQYDRSKQYLLDSIDIRVNNKLDDAASTSLIALAELEYEYCHLELAIESAERAFKITESTKSKSKQLQCCKLLAKAYEDKGELKKALHYYKIYDSLQVEQNSFQLQNIYKQKNKRINEQKEIIESYLKDIKDSIVYAKRIQNAILPGSDLMSESLGDHFVLYKPKDIVAGDFYWLEKNENEIYVAVADCTGHGVPGALVSVVCNYALNRCITGYNLTSTNEILDKSRELIVNQFEKSGADVKDGMDISLCRINMEGRTLQWSGANNPLWIVRNKEIIEFRPDKQPIGKHINQFPFTSQDIELHKDDILYLFSDGFADQFGGLKNKKFTYKRLKELILKIHSTPMQDQLGNLKEEFNTWKGTNDQVDDICLVGVKIA